MTTYKHIVQVHPVENWGKPNLHKVEKEFEYDQEWEAKAAVDWLNCIVYKDKRFKAVYCGRVNEATGELE